MLLQGSAFVLRSRTRTDQLLRNTELHERDVAVLHGDVDAALRGAEEAETLMKQQILEVQHQHSRYNVFISEIPTAIRFQNSICHQERRRAENSDASVRSLLQRLDDANKALTVQKQFAEAAAAVAAADLQSMSQRALRAEKQAKEFQDSLNSMQARRCICAASALQHSI